MADHAAIRSALEHAERFLDSLDRRRVSPTAEYGQLIDSLGGPLNDEPRDPAGVIEDLVRATEPGLLGGATGRFYGWVHGSALPAALAADWMTSAWDQNAAMYSCGPAAAVVEEVAGEWLKRLLRIPASASFGFVSGCQMAHVTALAAARHRVLARHDWDVGKQGLAGAPPIAVLAGESRHFSIDRALRLIGIGGDNIELVECDASSRISIEALSAALERQRGPTILCLQAGEVNSGAYDPFREACELAHATNAWVHIDGAFGLWANAAAEYRHLLDGAELADSWTTDGHKWLNVPYENGFAFVADSEAHHAAFSTEASYLIHGGEARDQVHWNPELSRRARGFPVYAALRSLGARGVDQLISRCCRLAKRLAVEIGALAGAETLVEPIINQGLVRFLAPDGDHDSRTEQVIAEIQGSGEAWFGPTTWQGKRAMRISLCNWRTTDDDVDRVVTAVKRILSCS